MIRKLFIKPALLLIVILVSTLLASSSDGYISIKGIVKDSLGNVLSGVDIFISSDNFNSKIFNTRTDESGKYILDKIVSGFYKVAAAKKGYLTRVEDLDAKAESSLNMTLNPIIDGNLSKDARRFPDTLDWVRRIPKKDILKETEAAAMVAQQDDGNHSNDRSQKAIAKAFNFFMTDSLPLRIELRQVASKEIGGSDIENGSEKKNSAALFLSGNIGPDCSVEMEGLKKRWKESLADDLMADSFKRDAEMIGVSGSYNFGEWGTLGFETFYGRDYLNIKKSQLSTFDPFEGNQKEWGYSAGWKKRIDAYAAFNIQIDHTGQEFRGDPGVSDLERSSDEVSIYNQALNASGSFQTRMSKDHTIDVGVSTQYYSNSDPLFHILSQRGVRSYYGSGELGRQLSFYGKDSWSIFDPLTISFGVNYYNFYYDGGMQAVTPVFEMEYRSKSGSSVKTEVSYIINTVNERRNASELAVRNASSMTGSNGDISCKIDMRKEMKDGSSITTRLSYTPLLILDGEDGLYGLAWNDVSLYMTDGNASSKRAGTFIEKKFKFLNGGIGLDYGEIEGTFSSLLPEDLPLQTFRQGNLNYLLAIVKAYCSGSETELSVRFRRVKDSIDEENIISSDDIPLKYSMLSVQFGQRVPVLKVRGMNLRAIVEYDDILAYNNFGGDPLKSLMMPVRRIGGGFIVTF